MPDTVWWASQDFWRKCAIFVTAFMAVILIMLTFHSVAEITSGSDLTMVAAVETWRAGEGARGDTAVLSAGQRLALKYFLAAMVLFLAQTVFGLLAGRHGFRSNNHPALAWLIAHAFGNFLGAGVWGFMQTLPQINLYTHGTQWTASHGHLAFFEGQTQPWFVQAMRDEARP